MPDNATLALCRAQLARLLEICRKIPRRSPLHAEAAEAIAEIEPTLGRGKGRQSTVDLDAIRTRLAAGQGVSQISREMELPVSTVSDAKKRIQQSSGIL